MVLSEYNFETILSRMLSTVPDDIDKREGSIIYDALAPAALMMAEQYYMLSQLADMFFADTASGIWLDRVAGNFGIKRKTATKAVRKICCTDKNGNMLNVAIGSRFSVNGTVFSITERLNDGKYSALCEQEGSLGNSYSGAILPIDYVEGLAQAVLEAEVIVAARDIESDEELRERLYESVRRVPFGGNRDDYCEKALSIPGVGECVVFSASDGMGEGNVGLVIADELGGPASDELIGEVEVIFCGDTAGNGIAPIGHTVMVNTCEWLDLNISAVITLKEGSSLDIVIPFAHQAVTDYIKRMKFEDATVFAARIMSEILACHDAVLDVSQLLINGASGNLALEKGFDRWQIPCVESFSAVQG